MGMKLLIWNKLLQLYIVSKNSKGNHKENIYKIHKKGSEKGIKTYHNETQREKRKDKNATKHTEINEQEANRKFFLSVITDVNRLNALTKRHIDWMG